MRTINSLKSAVAPRITQTVTIANGASISEVIDLTDTTLVGLIMPAVWTTAALNIGVSVDGTNWLVGYDAFGSAANSIASPVVNGAYALDANALLPWRFVRLRSGTAASPVNQGANRVFTLIKRALA